MFRSLKPNSKMGLALWAIVYAVASLIVTISDEVRHTLGSLLV